MAETKGNDVVQISHQYPEVPSIWLSLRPLAHLELGRVRTTSPSFSFSFDRVRFPCQIQRISSQTYTRSDEILMEGTYCSSFSGLLAADASGVGSRSISDCAISTVANVCGFAGMSLLISCSAALAFFLAFDSLRDFSRRSLFRASLRARRFSGLPDLFLFFDVRVDPSEFSVSKGHRTLIRK